MQIRLRQGAKGGTIQFIRWEYSREDKRGKAITLGTIPQTLTTPPRHLLDKMTESERRQVASFFAEKNRRDQLDTSLESVRSLAEHIKQVAEVLTICTQALDEELAVAYRILVGNGHLHEITDAWHGLAAVMGALVEEQSVS